MWYEITFRALMFLATLTLSVIAFIQGDVINGAVMAVVAGGFAYLLIRTSRRALR